MEDKCNKPNNGLNPTLWKGEDRLGQTLNSANIKGNTVSVPGEKWEQGQGKGYRKRRNSTYRCCEKDLG